jgi:hypothetical protein
MGNDVVEIVVEIPKGSRDEYGMNHGSGEIVDLEGHRSPRAG